MSKKILFISFVVSLGGFLFGFDAGIISGVMSYAGPEFNLDDIQSGWVVSSPSFAAMIAMLFSGKLSNKFGRKKILLIVAFLYALSALLSAIATSYEMLYIARMIGGLAFGAALVIAPMYIAEVSTAENRGKLVAIQQLNIVLGFFAAFLSNYFFNKYNTEASFLTDANVWRWMLGVEFFPAILYFLCLFFVPNSPRWLFLAERFDKAKLVLANIHGEATAEEEYKTIEKNSNENTDAPKGNILDVLKPGIRFIFIVGLVIGILQQITGINAVYFYATSIFKQTGIGTDAAFSSGILLSSITVIFTIISMYLIDRLGRRILILVGTFGISVSLLLCAYGFHNATYQLNSNQIAAFEFENADKLGSIADREFTSDVEFKNKLKSILGNQIYSKNDGVILEAATTMNADLVLYGILGFIACFAFSLGPVMWVLLSELYPLKIRGLAIGMIAFVNSLVSSIIQLIFPWELSNLGNAMTFFLFGAIAMVGFLVMVKIVPETKGKTLEELELELTQN